MSDPGQIDLSVLASFHDAELCSIDMDRGKRTLSLGFEITGGSRQTISFEGALTYRIDNVDEQNVVYRILVTGISSIDPLELKRLIGWTYRIDNDNILTLGAERVHNVIRRIESGELILA